MLLELKNVHVHYHKVAALKGIDMGVPDDGIVTIIGANGAGKSTTLRAISRLVRISTGEIRFRGERIDTLPPEKIVALGIAHVPEGRRVFPGLRQCHSAAVFGFQPAADASSRAAASTQREPPGPVSRFQNGALVLR